MPAGNKGDWSEFFVFIKLLSHGRIDAADENLERIEGIFYPISHLERVERIKKLYHLDKADGQIVIEDDDENAINRVSTASVQENLNGIFNELKSASGSSFTLNTALPLMEKLSCINIKAGSRDKGDIIVAFHDLSTQSIVTEGFSIKSLVGGEATLLNAAGSTNFIYEVKNLNSDLIGEINSIDGASKVKRRLSKIFEMGGNLKFHKIASENFESNLRKIDTLFPQILSELLIEYYSMVGGSMQRMKEVWANKTDFHCALLKQFNINENDVEYKLRNLLMNSALGMTSDTPWSGFLEAAGGFLVLKDDGEVLCYHVYNLDKLRTYLFNNSKFETSSTSRHGFAELYMSDDKIFFNLNLQIRFSH